jgi:hypothetical protein
MDISAILLTNYVGCVWSLAAVQAVKDANPYPVRAS